MKALVYNRGTRGIDWYGDVHEEGVAGFSFLEFRNATGGSTGGESVGGGSAPDTYSAVLGGTQNSSGTLYIGATLTSTTSGLQPNYLQPQSTGPLHNPLTTGQRDEVDLAGHLAGNILATRPECGKYLTDGKKVDVLKLFSQVQRAMTFDPNLDVAFPAETDTNAPGKIKTVRLGRSFFDLSKMDVGLLAQFNLINIDAFDVLARSYQQRAFIMLHEFKHAVTGKEHKTADEYMDWLRGIYENCFKPKK